MKASLCPRWFSQNLWGLDLSRSCPGDSDVLWGLWTSELTKQVKLQQQSRNCLMTSLFPFAGWLVKTIRASRLCINSHKFEMTLEVKSCSISFPFSLYSWSHVIFLSFNSSQVSLCFRFFAFAVSFAWKVFPHVFIWTTPSLHSEVYLHGEAFLQHSTENIIVSPILLYPLQKKSLYFVIYYLCYIIFISFIYSFFLIH